MTSTLTVGIVAAVRLYRDALAATIARERVFSVAWTAANLDTALEHARDATDVIVVDAATPESLRLIRLLRELAPHVAIVAFAAHEIDEEIVACAEAGVAGIVPPESTVEELIATISAALRGEVRCSPRVAAALFRRVAAVRASAAGSTPPVLTSRERDILRLIERGCSNKEIASRLHIQIATVKNHVHHLLEKLHVSTRSEAAAKQRSAGAPRFTGASAENEQVPTI